MVRTAILLALVGGLLGLAIWRRPAAVVLESDLAAALADATAASRRGDDDESWLVLHVRHADRAASAALDARLAREGGRAAL